jgi:branched-chain amino acid transport system substrate-binding protein
MRGYFFAAVVAAFGVSATDAAFAQSPVKIGVILPMTGQQQSTGKQELAAIKLYMAQRATRSLARRLSSSSGTTLRSRTTADALRTS